MPWHDPNKKLLLISILKTILTHPMQTPESLHA